MTQKDKSVSKNSDPVQECISPVHVSHVVDVLKSSEHAQQNVCDGQLTHAISEMCANQISGWA